MSNRDNYNSIILLLVRTDSEVGHLIESFRMQITQEICRKAEEIPADSGVCIPSVRRIPETFRLVFLSVNVRAHFLAVSLYSASSQDIHTWDAYEHTIQPLKNAHRVNFDGWIFYILLYFFSSAYYLHQRFGWEKNLENINDCFIYGAPFVGSALWQKGCDGAYTEWHWFDCWCKKNPRKKDAEPVSVCT